MDPTHTGWRGVGRSVPADAAEPLAAAGLDWTVRKVAAKHHGDTRWRWLERSDSKRPVGVVLPSYEPQQNSEAFGWAQGDARLVFAAELDEGSRVIVAAAVDEPVFIPGDPEPLQVHIVATTRHDSKGSFEAFPVVVRGGDKPLIIAEGGKTFLLRGRHGRGGGIPPRAAMLLGARQYGQNIMAMAARLAATPINAAEVDALVDTIKPARKPRQGSRMVVANDLKARRQIDGTRSDLKQGWAVEPSLADVRGTAWGAFLSVVHYDNYLRQAHARKDSTLTREERVLLRILFEDAPMVRQAMVELEALGLDVAA